MSYHQFMPTCDKEVDPNDRERALFIAAIREGQMDVANGNVQELSEAFAEIRELLFKDLKS